MTDSNTDDSKRTIVLIYGILDNGNPFWVFAAVKPSKYQLFLGTYKSGEMDVQKFDPYGEIIVCGEGKGPPTEVTVKVAEMYQTDANTLMQSMRDEPPPEGKK